jgi:RNA polymerase sigma-70 factor (ECF subfamily)
MPSNTGSERTDEEIARLVQNGDTEAFGVLVERYEEKLLRYGRKFLAAKEDIEDIVQDAFINAYRNIRSFDTKMRFSPWMYRIAHNAYANELRRRSRSPITLMDFDTLISHSAHEDPPPSKLEEEEMKRMVEAGLEKLEPKYREVILLYYQEEMSYQEIADILQVPTGTVGVRIKRAKDALKKAYKDMNITYER